MAFLVKHKRHGWQVIWQDATKGRGKAGRRYVKCTSNKHEAAFNAAKLTAAKRAVFLGGATNRDQRAMLERCYQALELVKAHEALAAGGYGHKSRFDTPLFDLIDQYLAKRERQAEIRGETKSESKGVSELTVSADKTAIDKFKAWGKARGHLELQTGELGKEHLEDFRSWLLVLPSQRDRRRSISVATVNKTLTHIRAAINDLCENQGTQRFFKVDQSSLSKGLRLVSEKKKLPKRFKPGELVQFFREASSHDFNDTVSVKGRQGCKDYLLKVGNRSLILPWFILLALSGCRRHEAERLKWSDVDLEHGAIVFKSLKTGERRLPLVDPANTLSPSLLEILKAWRENSPEADYVLPANSKGKKPTFPTRAWNAVKQKSGVAINPKDLRSNCTAFMASCAIPLAIMALFSGHGVKVCERHYLSFASDRLEGGDLESVMGLKDDLESYLARLKPSEPEPNSPPGKQASTEPAP